MSTELLDLAVAAAGGQDLWNTVSSLQADVSINGPVWGLKGWPPGMSFDQVLTVDTAREHIIFTPFTRPEWQMIFDGPSDSVTVQTLDGEPVEKLAPARAAFKGMLRNTAWDAAHLGYFLGYACWNYFTSPFLFAYPGVKTHEIEPWHEEGQTWRRLEVRFPPGIATHSPKAVFYYDPFGMQRRMDYVAEVNNSFLVGHYTGHHKNFDGLVMPTRRRMFRRNPDNSVNLNFPSITVDVHDVDIVRSSDEQERP